MSPRPFTLKPAAAFCALALAAGYCSSAAAEEPLGRLFFTPERRQALDQQRQSGIQEKAEIPADPTLTINGVVTRSSGKRTVWINGVARNDREAQDGVTVSPSPNLPGKVVVDLNGDQIGRTSVGATVNRNTGETEDLLGGGRIRVHTSRTATR